VTDIVGYEVRTDSGYTRTCWSREEAVLAQLADPRYRAVAIHGDGSTTPIY
jgi:hypothetical protein